MPSRHRPSPRPAAGLLAALWLLAALPHASAQDAPASEAPPSANENYLRATGLLEPARELEEMLVEGLELEDPRMPPERRERMGAFFSFVMTVNGLTPDRARDLQARGIDLVHAITADARPLTEQSLMADLVLVAEVAALEDTPGAPDGYASTVTLRVEDVLKGDAPAETVLLRQRSPTADRTSRRALRDVKAEPGDRLLLLLSQSMYRFYAAVHAGRQAEPRLDAIPEADWARSYSLYRWYRMDGDRLDWGGLGEEQTKWEFQELRWLDALLKGP